MYVSFLFVSCHDLKIDALSRFALEEGSIAATCDGWHTAFYPHNVCGRERAAFDTQHMRYAARLFGGSRRRKLSPAIEGSAHRRRGQTTHAQSDNRNFISSFRNS